jgi:hypothetical protein
MSDDAGTLSECTSDEEINMMMLQAIKTEQTAPPRQTVPPQESHLFVQQLPLIGRIPMGKALSLTCFCSILHPSLFSL